MHNYNIYWTYKIGNKEIHDHIHLASKVKMKEFKIDEYKNGNDIISKMNFIEESNDPRFNYLDRQLREKYEKLSDVDKKRMIESGILAENDVKYDNMDIFINKTY